MTITVNNITEIHRDATDDSIARALEILGAPASSAGLRELNSLLEFHGVEAVSVDDDGTIHNDGAGDHESIEYLNTGDLYVGTIAIVDGEYQITTYSDLRDRLENSYDEPEPSPDGMLRDGNVNADNLAEWITAALEIDWSAAYDETQDDGEPTDESSDLGDVLEAIYWYGVDCHSGQFSDAYKLQCAVSTVFTPGCSSTGPEPESAAMDMYRTLCEAAGASQSDVS